jgi:hypothetical protein
MGNLPILQRCGVSDGQIAHPTEGLTGGVVLGPDGLAQ